MEEKKYIYKCEKCNFETNYNSSYIKHLESTLHQTGKKKIRSDKKENNCKLCDVKLSTQQSLKQHMLNCHTEIKKEELKYYCKYCDIGSNQETNYKKHLSSKKHQHILKLINFNTV